MLDEQLRHELAVWADGADRLRVPDVSLIRRRLRRRRAKLTSVGACLGAAAVAAAALAASLPAALRQPAPASRETGWRPAGPVLPPDAGVASSPYFVTLDSRYQRAPALVTNALTGLSIAIIGPPAAAGPDGFEAVSAAADDRTFVLAGQRPAGGQDQLYELQLDSQGRPFPLRRLRLPLQPRALSFALSPDGSQLAVAVRSQQAIEVITLATGKHSVWAPFGHRIITGLAWAGQHELAVSWYRTASPLAGRVGPSGGLGLLQVGIHGGSLAQASLLISARVTFGRFRGLVNPLVSADGSVIFGTMTSNGPNHQAEVVEFSGRTGRPLRAVGPAIDESGMGQWCGAVWADPAGLQVAMVCGQSQEGVATPQAAEGVTRLAGFRRRDLHVPVYSESIPTATFIGW